jgi:hypothetical protein
MGYPNVVAAEVFGRLGTKVPGLKPAAVAACVRGLKASAPSERTGSGSGVYRKSGAGFCERSGRNSDALALEFAGSSFLDVRSKAVSWVYVYRDY